MGREGRDGKSGGDCGGGGWDSESDGSHDIGGEVGGSRRLSGDGLTCSSSNDDGEVPVGGRELVNVHRVSLCIVVLLGLDVLSAHLLDDEIPALAVHLDGSLELEVVLTRPAAWVACDRTGVSPRSGIPVSPPSPFFLGFSS